MRDVIVEVSGGVAEVTVVPNDVDVTIIDWDDYRDMTHEERREWARDQNEVVQQYLKDQGFGVLFEETNENAGCEDVITDEPGEGQ